MVILLTTPKQTKHFRTFALEVWDLKPYGCDVGYFATTLEGWLFLIWVIRKARSFLILYEWPMRLFEQHPLRVDQQPLGNPWKVDP